MTSIMKSTFLAGLSRLSTDFTICCSKEGRRKRIEGKKKKCPSDPGGVRWILHLDTGLIQFGHIQAESEIISRLVRRRGRRRRRRFGANWEREVSQQTQLMEMM